jgi:hypothetical protein
MLCGPIDYVAFGSGSGFRRESGSYRKGQRSRRPRTSTAHPPIRTPRTATARPVRTRTRCVRPVPPPEPQRRARASAKLHQNCAKKGGRFWVALSPIPSIRNYGGKSMQHRMFCTCRSVRKGAIRRFNRGLVLTCRLLFTYSWRNSQTIQLTLASYLGIFRQQSAANSIGKHYAVLSEPVHCLLLGRKQCRLRRFLQPC